MRTRLFVVLLMCFLGCSLFNAFCMLPGSHRYQEQKIGIIPYTDDGHILLCLDRRSANCSQNCGWGLFSGKSFSRNLQFDAMQIFYDKSRCMYPLQASDFQNYVLSQVRVINKSTKPCGVVAPVCIFFVRVAFKVNPIDFKMHPALCFTQDSVVDWTWVKASELVCDESGRVPVRVMDEKGLDKRLFVAFVQNLSDPKIRANILSIALKGTLDPTVTQKYVVQETLVTVAKFDSIADHFVRKIKEYYPSILSFINIGFVFYNSCGNFLLHLDSIVQAKYHIASSNVNHAWGTFTLRAQLRDLVNLNKEDLNDLLCSECSHIINNSNARITHVVFSDEHPFLICLVSVPDAQNEPLHLDCGDFAWVNGRRLLNNIYSVQDLQNKPMRLFVCFSRLLSMPTVQNCLTDIVQAREQEVALLESARLNEAIRAEEASEVAEQQRVDQQRQRAEQAQREKAESDANWDALVKEIYSPSALGYQTN